MGVAGSESRLCNKKCKYKVSTSSDLKVTVHVFAVKISSEFLTKWRITANCFVSLED